MNEVLIGRVELDEMRSITRRLLSQYRPNHCPYEREVERLLILLNTAAQPKPAESSAVAHPVN